jgi:hypothetical protein
MRKLAGDLTINKATRSRLDSINDSFMPSDFSGERIFSYDNPATTQEGLKAEHLKAQEQSFCAKPRGHSFHDSSSYSCNKSSSVRSYFDAVYCDGTSSEDVGCLSDSGDDKTSSKESDDDCDIDEKIKWFFMRVE